MTTSLCVQVRRSACRKKREGRREKGGERGGCMQIPHRMFGSASCVGIGVRVCARAGEGRLAQHIRTRMHTHMRTQVHTRAGLLPCAWDDTADAAFKRVYHPLNAAAFVGVLDYSLC